MGNITATITVDLLVILVSCMVGFIGFYLGSELRKHERSIKSLGFTIGKHDDAIRSLRTELNSLAHKK